MAVYDNNELTEIGMKKNILLLAGGLAMLVACDSSDYDLINLVPEEYHKILYINNAGEQELTLYDTGEIYTYQMSVIKAGSEPSLTASAEIRILTQDEVDEQYSEVEAVDYQIIPETSYSLSATTVDFASEERYKLIDITLDPTIIKNAIDEGDADTQWVLPIELVSENDSVNADMDQLFLQITGVVTPSLGFTSTDVTVTNYTYGSMLTVSVPFGLDTENTGWDITAEVSLGDESAIDTYNRQNSANFQLLPEGTYTLPATVELPSGTTTSNLEVIIDGTALELGEYMLPIHLSNVDPFQISEDYADYLLAVRILGTEIDRSNWTGEANTDEPTGEGTGNGVIECAFDGDESTYWHSAWASTTVALPHILTFDTQAEHNFAQFALKPRTGTYCGDTGGGVFYVSSDNTTWTEVGTFTMNGSEDYQYFTVTQTRGRYFRIEITVGNRSTNTNMAEVYAYEVE